MESLSNNNYVLVALAAIVAVVAIFTIAILMGRTLILRSKSTTLEVESPDKPKKRTRKARQQRIPRGSSKAQKKNNNQVRGDEDK
jgi:hypothetical protein